MLVSHKLPSWEQSAGGPDGSMCVQGSLCTCLVGSIFVTEGDGLRGSGGFFKVLWWQDRCLQHHWEWWRQDVAWGAGKGQGLWLFIIDGPGQLRQALLGSKPFSWRGWEEVPFEFCTLKGSSVVFLASQFPQVSEASLSPRPPRCKLCPLFREASGAQL